MRLCIATTESKQRWTACVVTAARVTGRLLNVDLATRDWGAVQAQQSRNSMLRRSLLAGWRAAYGRSW
jgi:hypothetical protein